MGSLLRDELWSVFKVIFVTLARRSKVSFQMNKLYQNKAACHFNRVSWPRAEILLVRLGHPTVVSNGP